MSATKIFSRAQPRKYFPQKFLALRLCCFVLLFSFWRQSLGINQHCIVLFIDYTTPHSIRVVARLFEQDETESRKIIISSVVYKIEIKIKGGSPFCECESRDCKIRSLSMRSISCCTRPHVFTSFARLKKKFNWLELFFQSLANDDVKVNKPQRISTKIRSEPDSLSGFTWYFKICSGIWSCIKRQTSGTSSGNEWQRMTTSDNKRYNEWQWVTTRGTTSDNEWYNEWQRVTKSDNKWQWVTVSDSSDTTNVNGTVHFREWMIARFSMTKTDKLLLQGMDGCN